MSATADKARFHLEQHVPELQELERKKIFTRDEITAIIAKRNEFEHVINARGSTPLDYARYAAYESNLNGLRKKRCKRLGIKSTSSKGSRTVFFIFDRATKKLPGYMPLWSQYIQYCIAEKANRKLAQVLTAALRLHPTDRSLWILAAKHYAESEGDMGTARSYMQRGIRFCKDEDLYLEYCKLEMGYLSKLALRRKVLGLDKAQEQEQDQSEDMIKLPSITYEDIHPDAAKGVEEVNVQALEKLANAPALRGAIPTAIYDAAMKQFVSRALPLSEKFFLQIMRFEHVAARSSILQHIVSFMHTADECGPEYLHCQARLDMLSVDPESSQFPAALGLTLKNLDRGFKSVKPKRRSQFAAKAVVLLISYLALSENMDVNVAIVLESSCQRYLRLAVKGTDTSKPHLIPPHISLEDLRKEIVTSDLPTFDQLTARMLITG